MSLFLKINQLFHQKQTIHQKLSALLKEIIYLEHSDPEKSDKIGLKIIDNFLKL